MGRNRIGYSGADGRRPDPCAAKSSLGSIGSKGRVGSVIADSVHRAVRKDFLNLSKLLFY